METADFVWGGLLVAGAAFEAYALTAGRQRDTLSETTRRLFKVRTPLGRAAFALSWAGFAIWYLLHVLELWR
jgi:hypothetical protein